jgi:hypothetical protein
VNGLGPSLWGSSEDKTMNYLAERNQNQILTTAIPNPVVHHWGPGLAGRWIHLAELVLDLQTRHLLLTILSASPSSQNGITISLWHSTHSVPVDIPELQRRWVPRGGQAHWNRKRTWCHTSGIWNEAHDQWFLNLLCQSIHFHPKK